MNLYDDNSAVDATTDRDYLKTISNIPILKRRTVFTEYITLADNEKRSLIQNPLSGVSSFQIVNDVFLFTFQNNTYIGELGKVNIDNKPEALLTNVQIDTTINTVIC